MNKNIIIGAILVLVAGTGVLILTSDNDDTDMVATSQNQSQQTSTEQRSESSGEAPAETPQATLANYVDYSPTALADAEGTERVLFFHAEWCSVCNFHEGQIEQSGVPEGITVIKADYDSEDALKDQYGVTVQSTFVWLDENGEVRQSWPFASGLRTPQDLFDVVQAG